MENNKFIVIECKSRDELVGALQGYANLYCHKEFTQGIDLLHEKGDRYFIELSALDDEHFLYAVNYLRYPENRAKFDTVLGYDIKKEAMYYIPEDDTEYDNCFVTYRNGESVKHTFDGSSQKLSGNIEYTEQKIETGTLKAICTIVADKPEKKGIFSWLFG